MSGDLDLQAICVDKWGTICDAVFYNNLKAKGLTHSGDEKNGREVITVDLEKIPADIKILFFTVYVFTQGVSLGDISMATSIVNRCPSECLIQPVCLSVFGNATGVLLAKMVRSEKSGNFNLISENILISHSRHFLDSISILNAQILNHIPTAPIKQKVKFNMQKGGVFGFGNCSSLVVGLGWDVAKGFDADLDCSCILIDETSKVIEPIFFGNLESNSFPGAVKHTGDNQTGKGAGDDEQIHINLGLLGETVTQMFFVINVYSQGITFKHISNPYCRVVMHGEEVCRFNLKESVNATALVIGRLVRSDNGNWEFHALGTPSNGSIWRDCLPDIQRMFYVDTKTLLQRTVTLNNLSNVKYQQNDCCVIS